MENSTQLKMTQTAALRILTDTVKILEQHNLRYLVYYGTLLGTIRHNGFIPWDDDVDIVMPRDDYEKFKKIAQESLPSRYFLQDVHTDREYPAFIPKVRDSETTLIEKGYMHLKNMNQGIFIDIFVAEPFKNSKFNNFRQLKIKAYRALLLSKVVANPSKIKKAISSLFSREFLIRQIEKNYKKAGIDNEHICIVNNFTRIHDSIFDNWKHVPFENVQVRVPKNYHECLTDLYGDYMQLPPKEKQIPLHITEHIRDDMSYTEYIKKYLNT